MSSALPSHYVCVRGSRLVCKHWLQPWLSLSCWQLWAGQPSPPSRVPMPELPINPELAPPALTWLLATCPWVQCWLVLLRKGLPQLSSMKRMVPQSLYMRWGSPQRSGSWCVPLPRMSVLWADLFTACPPCPSWQMKQAATSSLSCFSMQPPFADNMRPPGLCWTEEQLFTTFQAQAFQGGIASLLDTYIVFLPSAAPVMCMFMPCGLSHIPLEPGEAEVRAAAGSCLCCVFNPPSSLSLFPFCQGTLF